MSRYLFLLLWPLSFWCQNPLEVADSLFELGNYSKAISQYQLQEQKPLALEKIAQAYQALGNYKQSTTYYQKAIAAQPHKLVLQYRYAKLLLALHQYQKAKPLLLDLMNRDAENPNVYFEMGKLAEKTGDSLAIKYFNTTYNLDSNHQRAIFKIARHKLVKRKHFASIEYIDKGLAQYADNVELISLKAQNYYWLEDYDEAIVWFHKLIDLGETSEAIYESLSKSYANNYDFQNAIIYRNKTLAYSPNNAEALYELGVYHEKLHYFDKAEDFVRRSLELEDVSLSNKYSKLGYLCNRQKKYPEAIAAYKKALREDPEDIMIEFYIAMAKDKYYKDIDARMQVFEDLKSKHAGTPYEEIAKLKLKELKEEKFSSAD